MFIGILPRMFWKPECISAQAERAKRRACGASGHRCLSGNISATVSQMASESHTGSPSIIKTGTLPAAEYFSTPGTVSPPSLWLNLSCTSSNGICACRSSTQGRIDHDE